jgi:hypothetical protein
MTQGFGRERRRTFVLDIAGAVGLLLTGCAGASAASPPPREPHGGKQQDDEEALGIADLARFTAS